MCQEADMRQCRTAVGSILLLSCAACNRSPHDASSSKPATTEEKTAAAAAAEKLRVNLNNGACPAIYAEAAETFRRLEKPAAWQNACDLLHKRFGDWRVVKLDDRSFSGNSVVVTINAPEEFTSGLHSILIVWQIVSGRPARLLRLGYQMDGRWVHIPELPARQRYLDKYLDTPPDGPRRFAGRLEDYPRGA
jgi:hypothetical protein